MFHDITCHARREVDVYRLAARDPRVPRRVRMLLRAAIALSVAGERVVMPLLLLAALKRVPPAVLASASARAHVTR